jgi:4-hydroxy-3-methylbut-2-enyl diphosphate reductase IspH
MRNNKKTRILIKNDKMVTNNLTRVSKMHVRDTKGTRLNIKFSFVGNKGHKEVEGRRLYIECRRTPRARDIHKRHCKHESQKCFYFLCFRTRGC